MRDVDALAPARHPEQPVHPVAGALDGRAPAAVAAALVLAFAGAVGTAATVAAAAVIDRPGGFVAVGLAVQAGTAWVGLRWLLRRSRHRGWIGPSVAVVVALTGAALLVPGIPAKPAPTVPGEAFWRLPTGSTIRYVRLPADGQHRPDAVVVLHGGPGVPDMAGEAALHAALTRDGFTVYVYDQLGSGRSSRLRDPTGYTVERDVADLEAIRARIDADRMILIGYSYGATLAGHYLARHPDRVARLVLLSPGALDPADTSDRGVASRLDLRQQLRLYRAVLTPRPLLGYLLLQAEPAAAHAYLPDAEADARSDIVLRLSEPALHCAPGSRRRPPPPGSGFYALQYPQSARSNPRSDPRPAIAGMLTPALILKGQCDYLSWTAATDYIAALPNATLLYYRGAGHDIAEDRPDDVRYAVRAFLADAPLPHPAYTDDNSPADYQGEHRVQ